MTQAMQGPRIRNGINIDTLFGTLDVVKGQPSLGSFQFRARNRWMGGAHNQSQIMDFYAAGAEDQSRQEARDDFRLAYPRTRRADVPRHDAAVLPGYRSTLAYTRTGSVPDEALAWAQAVAASSGYVRLLGLSLPAVIQAPSVLPAGLVAAIERSAARFATAEESREPTAA